MRVHLTRARQRFAFTLIELLVVVVIIALLVALMLPALGRAAARTKRVVCMSNLRQTGQAINMFAEEHGKKYPWAIKVSAGGPLPSNYVYPYFLEASGELVSPKTLVCAGDSNRNRASNWSDGAGGLVNPEFQDASISYMIGLEAVKDVRGMLLLADRDLTGSVGNCGVLNYTSDPIVTSALGGNAKWTGKLHTGGGNVVLVDGSVDQVNNGQLAVILKNGFNISGDPNLSNCTLKPGGKDAQGSVVP